VAEQEFILPVTEEEYEAGGSKFITFPPGAKVGDVQYREVECGMPDWDTPGKSLKFPISVTEEGVDKGKEEKISTGVDSKSVWKLKEIQQAVLGEPLEMKAGADGKKHPVFKPAEYAGKPAVGVWTMQKGYKGGDPSAEEVLYPKLTGILPAGSKPQTESLM
jgi:hypothetical protein